MQFSLTLDDSEINRISASVANRVIADNVLTRNQLSAMQAALAAFTQPAVDFSDLTHKVTQLMATVADVQAALDALNSKEDAVIALLQAEKVKIDQLAADLATAQANSSDPAALDGLVASVNTMGTDLDAAIASVTPPPTP